MYVYEYWRVYMPIRKNSSRSRTGMEKIPLSTGWEIRLSPWHRGDPTIEQGVNRKNQELTIYNKAERVRKDRVNLCLDDMVAACFGSDVNFTNNDMR